MERLKNPQEFSLVYKQGRPRFGKYVVVSVLPTNRTVSRVGFAVGKKTGNAVERNKVKRRLKAIMAKQTGRISPGFDVIIGAKRGSVAANFQELEQDLCQALQLSGLLTKGVHARTGHSSAGVGEEHA